MNKEARIKAAAEAICEHCYDGAQAYEIAAKAISAADAVVARRARQVKFNPIRSRDDGRPFMRLRK